jgi:hypothetical protein
MRRIDNMVENEIVVQQPKDIMEYGEKAAIVLKGMLEKFKEAKIVVDIAGRRYMRFEGYQAVGQFCKTSVAIEWARPVKDADKLVGFEAKANVLDSTGRVIGSAESFCGIDEPRWAKAPIFQIKSMAQTRAAAKALRNLYGWVVQMADVDATPLEEMEDVTPRGAMSRKCADCGKEVSEKIMAFSNDRFKKTVCIDCQTKYK